MQETIKVVRYEIYSENLETGKISKMETDEVYSGSKARQLVEELQIKFPDYFFFYKQVRPR